MIKAVGSTRELINAQKDSSDTFHGLVQLISLFTIDYSSSGTFSYEATNEDLFLEEVDLDTAKAIGASGKFDLQKYPLWLQLTDDEYQTGSVLAGWPSSIKYAADSTPVGQLDWTEYQLGSLVWEEFEVGGETVWTFGDLNAAAPNVFTMSNLVTNLEPSLPAGAEIVSRDARRSYNN